MTKCLLFIIPLHVWQEFEHRLYLFFIKIKKFPVGHWHWAKQANTFSRCLGMSSAIIWLRFLLISHCPVLWRENIDSLNKQTSSLKKFHLSNLLVTSQPKIREIGIMLESYRIFNCISRQVWNTCRLKKQYKNIVEINGKKYNWVINHLKKLS